MSKMTQSFGGRQMAYLLSAHTCDDMVLIVPSIEGCGASSKTYIYLQQFSTVLWFSADCHKPGQLYELVEHFVSPEITLL